MDLQELRNEINDIDSQLQELFNKRMQISFKVAEYKIANNMPVCIACRCLFRSFQTRIGRKEQA